MRLGLFVNLRALRAALAPLRKRGFGRAQALLWQLPAAVLLRAWRALVQPCNATLLRAGAARRFPALPLHVLPMLLVSSAPHGAVVSLLLRTEPASFGILDHHAYVFDAGLQARLLPRARDSMVGCFEVRSESTGLAYPLTHLLFLNAPVLRDLMACWHIDARLYRHAPAGVARPFAELDLGRRDTEPALSLHHHPNPDDP